MSFEKKVKDLKRRETADAVRTGISSGDYFKDHKQLREQRYASKKDGNSNKNRRVFRRKYQLLKKDLRYLKHKF